MHTLDGTMINQLVTFFGLVFIGIAVCIGDASAQDDDVSVVFVGDLMLADLPGQRIKQGHNTFKPFASVLNKSDIRIGNLECVISTIGTAEDKPFTFRAHPRVLKLLKKHFDAVSLANNHTGDFGHAAFDQMLGFLTQAKMPFFGGGRDLQQAHQPLLFQRKGITIAVLGYNEFFPRSFEADVDRPGSAWSDDEQVVADIKAAREVHHADVVIPFMHWGVEDEPLATTRQQSLARLMIDAGADAVVGSHPHVTQNTEFYKGRPIVYSLGNFVFDGYSSLENTTGWALQLDVNSTGVRQARIHVARIDRYGTPHPSRKDAGQCWQRGNTSFADCRP
jgi:poly-gamma-glutamate capsule biosynthesis protein CapA/YwtB (metallophosphatase superfamily)